ncbi:hypothetical protein AB0M12_12045 [Nocardia vinacea]|uniref:hypothetical protein n=1 Tax=Nocardia vinacea TaxID=96468 RepID=UPI0034260A55
MNDEVRLDPDHLRNQGERLAELGDRVGQTYAGLRDSLAHAEGSWGDDDLGVAFAREFKPHADQLLANLRAMEESLHGTAAGMVDAASQFEVQDRFGASRVGTTAADLDSIGEPAPPWPDGSAGTSSPAGAQPPVTSDPAATFPAAGAPAYPTDRADPTERSIPGGSRTPDASAGRSTPESGPQRHPSDRAAGREAERGVGAPGSGNSGTPAGDSGRRPPAAAVFPPAAAVSPPVSVPPAATRGSSSAAAGRPTWASPPGGAGQRDTPWSGQPPKTAGPPAGAAPRPPGPRLASSPRTQKPADELPRDRRRSGAPPVTDPVVGWLARTLAENHDVRVTGFDTPGLQVPVIREFVAAVDRVLTDYPVIDLDVVAVAELDVESGPVWWSLEPRDARGTGAGRSITLDQRTAQEPTRATGTAESDTESAELEIYRATLREFGRALDSAGGGLARRRAQRVLIAEYLYLEAGRNSTLAEVVSGYQRWRAELTGDGADVRGFDVSRALGAAFADVVLRGDEASLQARALHALLVDATSR